MTGPMGAKCTSCHELKLELKQKKSRVLGVQMYLCRNCADKRFEPRPFLVLAGRRDGYEAIRPWIKPQKYVGAPITMAELE